MKLSYLELNGFRGYNKKLRIDFAESFTIIDGRNGVGKSSIFDAIEFALTGNLSKYDSQKAAGETSSDYIWWRGEGESPKERYVTLGFIDRDEEISVTRKEFEKPDEKTLNYLVYKLCDQFHSPENPISQLCSNAIIRDEQITKLSLDLKETDRYALLRNTLGANNADAWTERGSKLVTKAKQKTSSIQQEIAEVNLKLTAELRRLDEVRASALSESALSEVVERLRGFLNYDVAPDELVERVREEITAVTDKLSVLHTLSQNWATIDEERKRIIQIEKDFEKANSEKKNATDELEKLISNPPEISASKYEEDAKNLFTLATLGRQIGLHDGKCPLCAKGQSHEEFSYGIENAENIAKKLSENAEAVSQYEQEKKSAEKRLKSANQLVEELEYLRKEANNKIINFDEVLRSQNISAEATRDQVLTMEEDLQEKLNEAKKELYKLETLQSGTELERAQHVVENTKTRLSTLEKNAGRARNVEKMAQVLYDAARRAASETLDRRLDRVLPLMSELYRRLRPHPIWYDIEYSIRGDVRRFMTLRVGDELNPQFLFSSGQRRATGLAFLLSVNLSLAWSKWESIMLDDPVQHVDDFRTVHLAELAAQLVMSGKQVICAVEDPALAELLARRLPAKSKVSAKRVTLGPGEDGALVKLSEKTITPHLINSLIVTSDSAPHTN